MKRRFSRQVRIGSVPVGGGAPIVVQSMTNTDTADVQATARQVEALARAGSELVRVTVDTPQAAAQVPRIRERLDAIGCRVPLVGDFHYNGHKLLTQYPDCAAALAKYRINPGNVGKGAKRDEQFATMIECALRYGKPVRIGVNWGSLDPELLARLMDENARRAQPMEAGEVMREAVIASALESARQAEQWGLVTRVFADDQLMNETLRALGKDTVMFLGGPAPLPGEYRFLELPDRGHSDEKGLRRQVIVASNDIDALISITLNPVVFAAIEPIKRWIGSRSKSGKPGLGRFAPVFSSP